MSAARCPPFRVLVAAEHAEAPTANGPRSPGLADAQKREGAFRNSLRTFLRLAGTTAAVLGAIGALECAAAIPGNDSFATRIPLAGASVSAGGSNVGATKEVGEPDPNFTGGKSVWWTWIAPADGYLTISTAGSDFDTTLAVYTGAALTNLALVAFNDTDLATSVVTFNVTAGTNYQIQVDGCDNDFYVTNNAEGNVALQLSLGPAQAPPANDNFAGRVILVGSHINNVQGSNVGATQEPGEPFHTDAIGLKSVWWSWTAPDSGALSLLASGNSTRGSKLDTVLAIYTGNSVSNLTLVAGNDEDAFGYESFVTCNVYSNVTYQIAVDGFEGDDGGIRLDLDLGTALPVPANDNFANRIVLAGSNISTNVSNAGATYEPNEPMHLYTFGGKTVWWTWTAPASGGVTLTASNSALDTLVCVYKGTTLATLTFVAGNDDDYFLNPLGLGSSAFFNATSGTTYQIVVDGVDGQTGNFTLRLTLGTADTVPANDNFANRIALTGTNVTTTGSNLGSTLESGEPLHRGYYGGHSVWWRWTSPGPGMVTINTTNSVTDVPDTLLAVYTGSGVSSLTEIASDNNSGGRNWASRVTFPTRSAVAYQIAIDGVDGDEWNNLRLNIRYTPAAYSLTLSTNPASSGTVTANPPPDVGGGKYTPGTVVTLTAAPSGGNTFTGWSGDVISTNNPLLLAVVSNMTLAANILVPPAVRVWTGASASGGNWSIGQNWSGGVPNPGDDLIFPDGASRLAANTNDLVNNTVFNSLVIGAGGYVLRGNPVGLDAGLFATNGAGTGTVALNVQLNNDQTFACTAAAAGLAVTGNVALGSRTLTTDTTGNITLSGIISGTGGLIKTGSGTLSLTGNNANTYSGSSAVNQGTLLLGKTGVAVPGPLAIGDGTGGANVDIVRFNANSQVGASSSVTINSSGQLDLNGFSGSVGTVTMTGGSIDTGAGTLGLNGNLSANASSSQSTIAGQLSLQGATRTFTVADGAAATDLLISAVITNGAAAAGITKAGTGRLQLSAANVYNGATTVSAGTLALAHPAALGTTAQGTIVNNAVLLLNGVSIAGEALALSAATLQADAASSTWTTDITLADTCFFSVATNVSLTLPGVIGGSGAVTKTGDGTLFFSGASANAYSGVTTVNQGTLVLAKSAGYAVPGGLVIGDGTGGADADVVRLDAGQQIPPGTTVTLNSSGLLSLTAGSQSFAALAGSGHVDLGAAGSALTLGANNASGAFNGLISGTGQLIKAGTGSLTLTANNTYTGQTTVSAGQLIVNGQQSGSSVVVNSPGLVGGTGRVGTLSGTGTISPGTSPGLLYSGSVSFSANTTFRVELNGTTVGSGYDQLNVGGSVTLAGTLSATLGFSPAMGDSFTIIDNNANDAVVGAFAGLPEGAHLAIGSVVLQISYAAGPGANNVTLTRVAVATPTISSLSVTNATVKIAGTGQSGLTYTLQTATNLWAPISWTAVGTNTATNSAFQFLHTNTPALPQRFYRVRWP